MNIHCFETVDPTERSLSGKEGALRVETLSADSVDAEDRLDIVITLSWIFVGGNPLSQ